MKNFLRLTLVSVLSVALLTSCCKLGFKKSCSSECSHHSKKEEVKASETSTETAKPEVKKTKKSKKSKKAESANSTSTEVKTETKKD